MTNYNDGRWHSWAGVEVDTGCAPAPADLHPNTHIAVHIVNIYGQLVSDPERTVLSHSWANPSLFKVVKQYQEPKTLWVNEYKDVHTVYSSREAALQYVGDNAIRKAVEYREVQ